MRRPPIRHVGGETWELDTPVSVATPEISGRMGIQLPRGFKFRPSVPRIFWPVVSPLETLYASAAHDYLYRNKIGTQKEADDVFLRIMREHGQAKWRRCLAYAAVRLGGWYYWNDCDT